MDAPLAVDHVGDHEDLPHAGGGGSEGARSLPRRSVGASQEGCRQEPSGTQDGTQSNRGLSRGRSRRRCRGRRRGGRRAWSCAALGNCSGSLVHSMSKAHTRSSARCSRSLRCTSVTPAAVADTVYLAGCGFSAQGFGAVGFQGVGLGEPAKAPRAGGREARKAEAAEAQVRGGRAPRGERRKGGLMPIYCSS